MRLLNLFIKRDEASVEPEATEKREESVVEKESTGENLIKAL